MRAEKTATLTREQRISANATQADHQYNYRIRRTERDKNVTLEVDERMTVVECQTCGMRWGLNQTNRHSAYARGRSGVMPYRWWACPNFCNWQPAAWYR